MDSFTVDPGARAGLVSRTYEDLVDRAIGLQTLVAILLARLGGNVEITAAEYMKVTEQRPMVITWPPDFDLTERWQLTDQFGKPWKGTSDGDD